MTGGESAATPALPPAPRDPIVDATDAAIRVARVLFPRLAEVAPECLDDFRDSLAVMAWCAWEASHARGSFRRKLVGISRGKASRAKTVLEVAERWGLARDEAIAAVRDALDEAMEALAPRSRWAFR